MMNDYNNKNISSLHPIGFGTAGLSGDSGGYGLGPIDPDSARELLDYAFQRGISFFDTAPIYGFGEVETLLGRVCKRYPRDSYQVSSKGGLVWDSRRRVRIDNNPQAIVQSLDESLRRLDLDFIDVFFIHWPDPHTDIRRPMEVLHAAKSSGKIRFLGLSNTFPEDLERAMEIDKIDFVQEPLNLFDTDSAESLKDECKKNGIHFLAYATLDKGILTGSVDEFRVLDPIDRRFAAHGIAAMDQTWKFAAVRAIRERICQNGVSLLGLCLAHNLLYYRAAATLIGFKEKAKLEEALQCFEAIDYYAEAVGLAREIIDEYRPR